jgi:hypothetical protein
MRVSAGIRRLRQPLILGALLSLCPLLSLAQAEGAAKVVTLVGQVSVLRDNSPWALNVGDVIQPRQVIITGAESFAEVALPDGSKFEVFANSRVVFRDNPGNWKDLLDVLVGRIKVHVQKLGGQPNFNRVRTPTAVISVRGTVFDVAVEDEDDTTLISVEEGQVAVEHLKRPGPTKILNPGEWIRVYKNQPLAARAVDRGAIARGTARAAAQALYEIMYRTSRTPGGVSGPVGGAAPLPGDKDKGDPPPAPPPPPQP